MGSIPNLTTSGDSYIIHCNKGNDRQVDFFSSWHYHLLITRSIKILTVNVPIYYQHVCAPQFKVTQSKTLCIYSICRDFPNRCEAYFITLDRQSPVAGLQLIRDTCIDK